MNENNIENGDETYDEDEEWFTPPSWLGLLARRDTVVTSHTFGRWQGDLLVVLEGDGAYRVGVIGYGSCSGCDALMGCRDEAEVEALHTSVRSQLQWCADLAGVEAWLADQRGDQGRLSWYAHEADFDDVVEAVLRDLDEHLATA